MSHYSWEQSQLHFVLSRDLVVAYILIYQITALFCIWLSLFLCLTNNLLRKLSLIRQVISIIVYSRVYFLCFAGFSRCYRVPTGVRAHVCVGVDRNTILWLVNFHTDVSVAMLNGLRANVTETRKWEKVNIQIQYTLYNNLSRVFKVKRNIAHLYAIKREI